jgi:hypothetical protein
MRVTWCFAKTGYVVTFVVLTGVCIRHYSGWLSNVRDVDKHELVKDWT